MEDSTWEYEYSLGDAKDAVADWILANGSEAEAAAEATPAAKRRKTFNGAKQRLGGLDHVDVRSAAKAEEEKAKQILAMKRASAEGGGGGGGGEAPPAKPREVMLGKDGRPLSPLSAAR